MILARIERDEAAMDGARRFARELLEDNGAYKRAIGIALLLEGGGIGLMPRHHAREAFADRGEMRLGFVHGSLSVVSLSPSVRPRHATIAQVTNAARKT